MNLKPSQGSQRGFTIVEIMVVISVLGVLLIALTLFSFYRAGSLREKIEKADHQRSQTPMDAPALQLDSRILNYRKDLEARRAGLLDQDPMPSMFRVAQGTAYDPGPREARRLARKLLGAAVLRMHADQREEARELLKEASILGTMDPAILADVASIALEADMPKLASQQIEEALKLDSEFGDAWIVKARLALKKGNVAEARQSISTAAEFRQKNADIFLVWSEIYLAEGQPKRSEEALKQYHALSGKGN